MKDPNSAPADPVTKFAFATFGKPEAEFAPTQGQTALGVSVGLVFGACILAGAVFFWGEGPVTGWLNLIIGVVTAGITYWIWRARNWRLYVCPKGLIQIGAWRTQALAWSEIIELVQTCEVGTDIPQRVIVVGHKERIAITLVSVRLWQEMLKIVVDSARRHGVAIRTEFILPESK